MLELMCYLFPVAVSSGCFALKSVSRKVRVLVEGRREVEVM